MKIAGCHSVSRSLVVSAEKTIIEDEVMVSVLVKILGTSKTGLMCKDYLGGSAFGRKWRRSQERMLGERRKVEWGICPTLAYRVR